MTKKEQMEMKLIGEALEIAEPYSLEIEVIWSSLKFLELGEAESIKEAIFMSLEKWIENSTSSL